ncbi:MAG: hypothetical protein ACE5JX_18490 [Acidobacteriota bacterium]
MVSSYWGRERTYHHTAPVSMNYGLREGLAMVLEEGLEPRWRRHQRHHRALVAGIEALGLSMHVAPEFRLWPLNTVRIPEGVDDAALRRQLLTEFGIEIGSGLGELKGRVWRVGLMGESRQAQFVLFFLYALEKSLLDQGLSCPRGAGVQAAAECLES